MIHPTNENGYHLLSSLALSVLQAYKKMITAVYSSIVKKNNQNKTKICSLAELSIGEKAKVLEYKACDQAYRHKLLVMGLTPNTKLQITRVAPMGDPIEIRLRSYDLSIRKGEAEVIRVRRV